ncbi:MAG TPA: PKD domain-containing protein [Bacteroidales bacterium]|nr:PKD domain-containing protein [Bacteroidales bacterium]
MKKILYFVLVVSLVLFSCKRKPDPKAQFIVESGSFTVGQELYFENQSTDAVSYEWDFGDGYGSDEANPFHIYDSNGTFRVTLTATGENGEESVAELDVTIKVPTLLVIDVVEWSDNPDDYNTIPGVEVRLYESLLDWRAANDNWLLLGITDTYGSSVFSNLGPYVYYVDAYKGYNTANGFDNYTLASEDEGFITTPVIVPNYINFFTAFVDPADHSNKGTTGTREKYIIKKIVRRDAIPVSKAITTDGWKELYERSIKMK